MIVFTDAPTEQGIEAGDGVPKEEVPCVTTHVEVKLWKCSIFNGSFK